MRTIKIEVTQKHIDLGATESADSCPVALAIADKLKTSDFNIGVEVYNSYMTFELEKEPYVIECNIPESVEKFIKAFDAEEGGEPFEFELEIPDELALNEC